MENKNQKWFTCYVNWGVFTSLLSLILVILALVSGVSWAAKSQSDDAIIQVNGLSSKYDNVQKGIDQLNDKFDSITEIKIRP